MTVAALPLDTADVAGPLPVAPAVVPVAGMPAMPGVPPVEGTSATSVAPPAGPPIVVPTTGNPLPALAADSAQQQRAALDEGAAAEAAAKANADAQGEAAAKHEAEAEELRQTQERQARAMDEAHRQTTAALDVARDTHIPSFWEGREGKRAETAILVGLGGFARGLGGLSSNSALDALEHSVDSFHREQKERIDNLYKFSELKGRAEGELRENHTRELAALQAKYGATKLAIAARVEQQAALGQGRVDKAKAAALSAKLATEGQESILKAKATLAEINLRNAEAAHARVVAGAARSAAAEEKEIKPISSEFDKDEARLKGTARTPGLVAQQQAVRELGDQIREAAASGDKQKLAAAMIAAKEKISRLNTGAAPSSQVMKMFDSLQGTPEEMRAKLGQLLGDPKVSGQLSKGVLDLVDQSDEGMLKQIDKARADLVTKYLGKNGMAATPAQRRHALGRIEGVMGSVASRGGAPRYQEGGAPAAAAATAPPPGTPSATNAKGEKIYYLNGKWGPP